MKTETAQKARCAKCAKATMDGINAKTCAGVPQYLCLPCYLAFCHVHAACVRCYGANGSTATWRKSEAAAQALEVTLEELARKAKRMQWEGPL